MLLASLFSTIFPLLVVTVLLKRYKSYQNPKCKKVARCHPFSASFYLLCSCFSETRRKSAISAERPVRHLLWRHRHLTRAEQQGLTYKRKNDSSTALRPQKRCHSWPLWTTSGLFGPQSGLKILLITFDRIPFSSIALRPKEQRPKMSKLSSWQTSMPQNFPDVVRKLCLQQKKTCKLFSRQKRT